MFSWQLEIWLRYLLQNFKQSNFAAFSRTSSYLDTSPNLNIHLLFLSSSYTWPTRGHHSGMLHLCYALGTAWFWQQLNIWEHCLTLIFLSIAQNSSLFFPFSPELVANYLGSHLFSSKSTKTFLLSQGHLPKKYLNSTLNSLYKINVNKID